MNELFAESAFFITLIGNGENGFINVRHFRYPTDAWDSIESEPFKKTFAIGTGKQDFLSEIAKEANFKGDSSNKGILSAITNNVCFLARLLAAEKVSLYTINGKWGAGFETIYFNGDSFVKFEDMAYIIMQGDFNEVGDIGIPVPRQVMYYKYYDDILFISSIEILNGQVNISDNEIIFTSTRYKADCYIVPRLDTDFSSPLNLPSNYSFETSRIALGYALVKKDKGFLTPSIFSTSKNDIKVILKNEQSIEIRINTQISEMIRSGAREVFPNMI